MNYPSLVRQLPFILYLTLLGVVYIYNGHWANKTIRNIQLTEKQIRELNYEYVTAKGSLLAKSKPSEVSQAVAPLGLKELKGSPWVLSDSLMVQQSKTD